MEFINYDNDIIKIKYQDIFYFHIIEKEDFNNCIYINSQICKKIFLNNENYEFDFNILNNDNETYILEILIQFKICIDNIPIYDEVVLLFKNYVEDIDIYIDYIKHCNKEIIYYDNEILKYTQCKKDFIELRDETYEKINIFLNSQKSQSNQQDIHIQLDVQQEFEQIVENNVEQEYQELDTYSFETNNTQDQEFVNSKRKYKDENRTKILYNDKNYKVFIEFIRRPKIEDYYWRAKFYIKSTKTSKTKTYNLTKYTNEECLFKGEIWLKQICKQYNIIL